MHVQQLELLSVHRQILNLAELILLRILEAHKDKNYLFHLPLVKGRVEFVQ